MRRLLLIRTLFFIIGAGAFQRMGLNGCASQSTDRFRMQPLSSAGPQSEKDAEKELLWIWFWDQSES